MARMIAVLPVLVFCLAVPAIATAQQDEPVCIVEILQPAAGAEVTGTIGVEVKVTALHGARLPSTAFVGLDGAPWRPMERASEGVWRGQVDTTMSPNGERSIIVITDNKLWRTAVPVRTSNPLQVFFADLHSHTGYSDGTLTPLAAHRYARDVAKLDVFSLTDHLESLDEQEWFDTREVAWKANEDGEFVVIPGLEWTKEWGHLNIYDPKSRLWPTDPAEFYATIAAADVVAKFNHPGDGTRSHTGLAYSAEADTAVTMIELRNPDEELAFIRALDNGWHLAPEGSDDTHDANWGNVRSWTGILAPGLSRQCIWDAMKNRRVYSTLDRNCELSFTVNGAAMGDIVGEPVEKVGVVVTVADPDRSDTIAKIELYQDGKVVRTDEPSASSCEWKTTCTPDPGPHYYFAKVTQADGNPLWSAPVWVKVQVPPAADRQPVAPTEVHEAMCGCSIEGIGRCGNYIRIGGEFVTLEHPSLGVMEFCRDKKNGARIKVTGSMVDGKYVATTYERLD